MNKKQKKVIKSDGNDFQYKVKKMLSDAEWNARMSPYYNDLFSAKPREIDIIAEKPFLSTSESLYQGTVIVRLFIECKYIAEPTTFWFENRNLDKAKKVVDSMRVFHEVDKNSYVANKHHYLSDSLIAKLYKTEGKNFDGDPIYKAMTQCLNATIYYRNHPTDLIKDYNRQAVKELNYSVIICNSFEKFLKKDTVANSAACPITESFQLEVDYAYTAKDVQSEELFYIDVLNIDNFENFEKKILTEEVGLIKQKMSDDQRQVRWEEKMLEQDDGNLFNGL